MKSVAEASIAAPTDTVWRAFNDPDHIVRWDASDDWHFDNLNLDTGMVFTILADQLVETLWGNQGVDADAQAAALPARSAARRHLLRGSCRCCRSDRPSGACRRPSIWKRRHVRAAAVPAVSSPVMRLDYSHEPLCAMSARSATFGAVEFASSLANISPAAASSSKRSSRVIG
jgi:hypothetical protein